VKLKTDENLGPRCVAVLRAAGHDVATVKEEGLASASDRDVIGASHAEGRCLVTLDLDFANPLQFVPAQFSGIAVLRLPPRATANDLVEVTETLATALQTADVRGKLWVVQRGRIREHAPEGP
jgi:predicted nuclease of predicted toxin-antitoxin system